MTVPGPNVDWKADKGPGRARRKHRGPAVQSNRVTGIEDPRETLPGPTRLGALPNRKPSPLANTKLGLGLLLSLSVLAACSGGGSRESVSPNVVLVLVDDLGWMDLGCQGSTLYESPRIDALAAEGTRFTQAYSNCPVCSPSRAALMSGQNPGRVGFTGHITAIGRHRYPESGAIVPPDDFMHLRREVVTVAEALREAGYVSASIGKWHLGDEPYWPTTQGFDTNVAGHTHGSPASYFFPYRKPEQTWNPDMPNLDLSESGEGEYLTDRLTDEAVAFIDANQDRPFFLYLSHYAVHTPLEARQDLISKYEAKIAAGADGKNAVYAAMVETVDRSVGRVLDKLDELGLDERTVVAIASDNGGLASVTDNAPLRAGKGHLYEGGIRVPLIIRWPGHGVPGSLVHEPVTNADIYPFITNLAGLDADRYPAPDARDLGRLIELGAWQPRDLIWYYPHYSPQASAPGAAILSAGYKLIEFYDPPSVELYHLDSDISEERNLADRIPRKTEELRSLLNAWIDENVPIRHTPNPLAAGSSL